MCKDKQLERSVHTRFKPGERSNLSSPPPCPATFRVLIGVETLTNQVIEVLLMVLLRFMGIFTTSAHEQADIEWVTLLSAVVTDHSLPTSQVSMCLEPQ